MTCRSTLNSLCAAAGKIGTLICATIVVVTANRFEVGVPRTFALGLSSRSLTPPYDETSLLLKG